MSKPGDEVTFLKRTHELLEDGRMVIRSAVQTLVPFQEDPE
jgi:hypothetical protein